MSYPPYTRPGSKLDAKCPTAAKSVLNSFKSKNFFSSNYTSLKLCCHITSRTVDQTWNQPNSRSRNFWVAISDTSVPIDTSEIRRFHTWSTVLKKKRFRNPHFVFHFIFRVTWILQPERWNVFASDMYNTNNMEVLRNRVKKPICGLSSEVAKLVVVDQMNHD